MLGQPRGRRGHLLGQHHLGQLGALTHHFDRRRVRPPPLRRLGLLQRELGALQPQDCQLRLLLLDLLPLGGVGLAQLCNGLLGLLLARVRLHEVEELGVLRRLRRLVHLLRCLELLLQRRDGRLERGDLLPLRLVLSAQRGDEVGGTLRIRGAIRVATSGLSHTGPSHSHLGAQPRSHGASSVGRADRGSKYLLNLCAI